MWFLLSKQESYCGDTSYVLYGRDEKPSLGNYKVEYRSYISPSAFTQRLINKYKSHKKTIDGEIWERTEVTQSLDPLPLGHEEWLNHTFEEKDGNVYHRYEVKDHGWFIELNTLEEYLAFDKEYACELHRWYEDTPYEIALIDIME